MTPDLKVILEKSNPDAERGAVVRRVVSAKVAIRELFLDRGNQVKVTHLDGSTFELPKPKLPEKANPKKPVVQVANKDEKEKEDEGGK
jgi:hypothetical protein